MNISDGERVRTVIDQMGYTWTDVEEDAELLGIIACSVRQKSIDKVYSKISQWNRKKNKKSLITFISGCILPADKEKFLKLFDLVFPVSELSQLPDMLNHYGIVTPASLKAMAAKMQLNESIRDFWHITPHYNSPFEAFVPIQNGCDKFCTFCAVPYTRGREISRPSGEILEEVMDLIARNYKSITLLGQNVNSYGLDKKGDELLFPQLLEKIGELGQESGKEFWVYFTSPHPRDMSDEVIDTVAKYHVLGKQIHIPLQSGDEKVLIRMNRKHSLDKFRNIVHKIRETIPQATIFTDIIVGFTGESEEQFENTVKAMEEFRFNMAYIAQYSPRPGAASSRWADDILPDVKKERFRRLTGELQKHAFELNRQMIGRTFRVLVTGHDRKDGYLAGLSEGKIVLRFKSEDESLIGNFTDIRIISATAFSVEGELSPLPYSLPPLGGGWGGGPTDHLMTPKKRIAFKTLGCRLNQFETDALAAQFKRHDYEVVDYAEDADLYIINTCTVTNQGDNKSRKAINQAIKRTNEPAVIVTGCMVNGQKEKLQKLNGVSYFVENAQKTSIFQLVDAHFHGETISPDTFSRDLFGFEAADETFHTRSFIKIQDGCDNFCTYCIVPKVRGRAISRPVEDILENIRTVIGFGYKEVVLTGVNIGRYEYQGTNFETLVEKIVDIPVDFRLRISSIEPEGFGDKLFDLFSHPKMTPHLHLCLQSGSDHILLQMRRFYNVTTFMNLVEKIRSRYPDFNLTTDIIVGFPGETDEEFNTSCEISRQIGFSHIHTFKYSTRTGTRAERMPDQVPETVKQQRSLIIRNISEENKRKYRLSMIGKEQTVLVEKYNPKTKLARGYGEHYIPVEFRSEDNPHNRFVRVRLDSLGQGSDPVINGHL
jgi:tRNA-2-methylthio-N6-dimethylallyladenosine synthase